MKISLIPSALAPLTLNFSPQGRGEGEGGSGETEPLPFLTSYLVNDTLAVDAGCLGLLGSLAEQARIKNVLLSHTHMDHLASLPIFLENVYQEGKEAVTLHASRPVLECLQQDLFNGRLWPDFIGLSAKGQPLLKLHAFQPGETFALEGLQITPVAVNHAVPACGFIVEDEAAAVVFPCDTGPTEEIWHRANGLAHLKAIFLEATFPDALARLADISGHLTPATFARELAKITPPARIIAVHIKARYYREVVAQLQALAHPRLEIASYGQTYSF